MKTGISTTTIAKICGVSQGTVDRALNNRAGINQKTKERILSVAKEYGYRPNIHARCVAGGKSHLIGFVVFDLDNQYFSDLLTNIEAYCTDKGYSTIVMFTQKDPRKEIDCIQNLYHLSVDGIILCPINYGNDYERFLSSLEIPIVTFGNKLNGFPYVGIDNALAMKEVTEFVISKGYRKLIYVKPILKGNNTFAQTERLSSFVETCQKSNTDYFVTDFAHAEDALEHNMPCVFVCPTDSCAMRLLSVAAKHNAGIIGFDNIRLIDALCLKLDSVSYDVPFVAKAAVDYIINQEPITLPVKHSLVIRGSV